MGRRGLGFSVRVRVLYTCVFFTVDYPYRKPYLYTVNCRKVPYHSQQSLRSISNLPRRNVNDTRSSPCKSPFCIECSHAYRLGPV